MKVDYQELVTRSRRAAGLSDRIDDPLIERLAAMVRSTPSSPPARHRPGEPSRGSDRDQQGVA